MYKNSEGYPDPTASAAMKHIELEERLKENRLEHTSMKLSPSDYIPSISRSKQLNRIIWLSN